MSSSTIPKTTDPKEKEKELVLTSSSLSTLSSAQKEAIVYLKENKVSQKLTDAINLLIRTRPVDAFGFLIKVLQENVKPPVITKLIAREVLDSRSNPTVECDVYATVLGEEKMVSRSAAPSGASTGSREALELRDTGDKDRYFGKGVLTAVNNVNTVLSDALKGMDPRLLRACDEALCKADGTAFKTKLGGNSLTAISFALAEAGAALTEKPLFYHLASCFHNHTQIPTRFSLPRPMSNVLNGGKHAGTDLQIQEFMIVPKSGLSAKETVRLCSEVYTKLGSLLVQEKGASAKNLGDEGGYAPNLSSPHEALQYIERAVLLANYRIGEDCFLAIDAAASEFYDEEKKKYEVEKKTYLNTDEMIKYYLKLKQQHPALISIEDGLDESDYDGWTKLTKAFTDEYKDFMLVGDDLFTTNKESIAKGIEKKWANSLLLKVNQIGTITESMTAARLMLENNGRVIVSHRSGESCSALITDLGVAIGAQFLKIGAPARGERVAKYNRLITIEEYLKANELV
eukprot:TRINITY_DN3341_c0_g1_i1.p1 TRINITY_DN3341_c0_g1~~TRINITY_DN3341_c0_g1_i1.p1  ORF type:complete len:515 (+),score=96.66 TRINITY_DN3341_c0_g1_i1:33-1577(+)